MIKSFITKSKNFFSTDLGKLFLGVIAMIIAGIITAKLVKNKE